MDLKKRFKQHNSDLHTLLSSDEKKTKAGGKINSLENSKSSGEYQKLQ